MLNDTTTTIMKRERKRRTRVGVLVRVFRWISSSRTVWPSSSEAVAMVRSPMLSRIALNRSLADSVSAGPMACHISRQRKPDQRESAHRERERDQCVTGQKEQSDYAHPVWPVTSI